MPVAIAPALLSSNSFSHFATTMVATAFPARFVSDLISDINRSTPNRRVIPATGTVPNEASVAALVAHLGDDAVSVLVANAGGAYDGSPIAQADATSWLQSFDVNVLGVVRTVQALLPKLVDSGAGTILVMGSTAGRIVYENGGSYTAAKHGTAAVADVEGPCGIGA